MLQYKVDGTKIIILEGKIDEWDWKKNYFHCLLYLHDIVNWKMNKGVIIILWYSKMNKCVKCVKDSHYSLWTIQDVKCIILGSGSCHSYMFFTVM